MSDITPQAHLLPARAGGEVGRPRPALSDDETPAGLEGVDLKEALSTLRRHWFLVTTIIVLCVAAAAYTAWTTKPVYRAEAIVRLIDTRRAMTGSLDEPTVSTIPGAWTDPIQSQLQVLNSRSVASDVVQRQALGLQVQPVDIPGRLLDSVVVSAGSTFDTLRFSFAAQTFTVQGRGGESTHPYGAKVTEDGITFILRGRPARATGVLLLRSPDAAVFLLLTGLDAKQRKMTDVIDVTYSANDPFVAQQVVNASLVAFQSLSEKTAQQQSKRRREFIEEQLHQTDSLLAIAQQRLSTFRSASQVYGSEERVSAEQQGLMDLETRREELAANRGVYQSLMGRLDQHNTGKGDALRALVASPGIAENPVVQADYQQLVELEATRDSLTIGRWSSAPSNPDVQRVQALVASTESKLADAVRSQITSLDARISALDELKRRNAVALQRLPATQAGEARLVEQVETTRHMAEQLREEYQKSRIAEAIEAGQVEIVDLATVPQAPISRGPRATMLLGLLVGLLLGGGAAFVVERLNTSIRRREDIEAVLQLPGLAIIPQIAGTQPSIGELRFGNLHLRLPPAMRSRMSANGKGDRAGLVTVSNLRSTGAEAFRTLRTNLIFSQAVQSLRTIVVTSPSPQDGKTTTSANLAVTFAQQGLRVLLVDCDLRRGRLHSMFRVGREPGLTQVLVGQEPLAQCIKRTLVDNLFFLPSGALPPNPSELLGGSQTRDIVEQLSRDYDVVILDTPPVHVAGDALILGSIADGVILVVRAGQTERHSATDALQRLYAVGARVVGAVLNDPDHKVPQYGGYYTYEYYDSEETAQPVV